MDGVVGAVGVLLGVDGAVVEPVEPEVDGVVVVVSGVLLGVLDGVLEGVLEGLVVLGVVTVVLGVSVGVSARPEDRPEIKAEPIKRTPRVTKAIFPSPQGFFGFLGLPPVLPQPPSVGSWGCTDRSSGGMSSPPAA